METKLPTGLTFTQWFTEEKDLPKEYGIWCVVCKMNDTKEEWFSFAGFVPCQLPNCKIDFDEWKVLGVFGHCFARASTDNRFEVIAWSQVKKY